MRGAWVQIPPPAHILVRIHTKQIEYNEMWIKEVAEGNLSIAVCPLLAVPKGKILYVWYSEITFQLHNIF